ncbi:MAG: zf-HC2 domain-containing protein [Armatimonadetes bacterium]|nr:zf-HC2 domain-containing protein [Armatimonadota bacterium]MCX7966865.1 zf-HC2 domain-containing protein [Armatimonadota bacterium]MDW8141823.1 zf-HC2 domain-containing protein [Armatimonadota bacterium]
MDRIGKSHNRGCPEWSDAISAMVDGELSPYEQQRLWMHLQTCPNCRQYYRQLQAVKTRVQKTNWAALWAKAIRENRKLRKWLVAAVVLTAIVSVTATTSVIQHFRKQPQMTPTAALGIFRYHLLNPFEWAFNPSCEAGSSCMAKEKANVTPIRLGTQKGKVQSERAGVCECLGVPILVYLLKVNGHPVMLLHFNISTLPIKLSDSTVVCLSDKTLNCRIVADMHLLIWRERQNGFALIVPYGKVNPLKLVEQIEIPR